MTASYSGDANYGTSTSQPLTLPSSTDFNLALSQTGLIVQSVGTVTDTVTVTPVLGFNQAVTLACPDVPSYTTCTLSPTSVTLNGTNSQEQNTR